MTQDLIVRLATEADAPALAAIYEPYVRETAITFEYVPPTAEEFAERMRRTMEFYPYVVAVLDGAIVGYAYAARSRTGPHTTGRWRPPYTSRRATPGGA